MNYHLTPVKMAMIKKSTNNKYWRECGEKGTLLYCWWECKLVQPQWKTVWRRFLKKIKNRTIYDPPIPPLGVYPKKMKSLSQKRYLHPCVHSSTIYNSQDMEAT